MNRREILGLAGIGMTGLSLGAVSAAAQHPHHHDKLHGECLKACDTAATVCNETFHHCFHKVKDGHPEHHEIATITIDCQEFCKLSAELLARESPLIITALTACAESCKLTALACSKHDDPQMKECADACKKCETASLAMAKVLLAAGPNAAEEKPAH
jgi:hypothetical protein